jgi:hypothetical protein
LEGIGVFSLVLEANGFKQLRLKKSPIKGWELETPLEAFRQGKVFALYTGTESAEEKELVRNIYNGTWDVIPSTLATTLRSIHPNNQQGEIVKVFMITSSGSEGINLRNTRYVHIMEPYWHSVRTEQVIGRARRICSHNDLPVELQTVEVFLYLMTFTEKQKSGEESMELKLKDLSKRAPFVPLTSDEALYEISNIKEEVNMQLIRAIKESSIDCAVYSKKSKEGLHCLSFGSDPSPSTFSFVPDLNKQANDQTEELNVRKTSWTGKVITINGVKYVGKEISSSFYEMYDFESYEQGMPLQVGSLEIKKDGSKIFLPLK